VGLAKGGERRAELCGHRVESGIPIGGEKVGGMVNGERRLSVVIGRCDHDPQRQIQETPR
jgi:hypothetical protein